MLTFYSQNLSNFMIFLGKLKFTHRICVFLLATGKNFIKTPYVCHKVFLFNVHLLTFYQFTKCTVFCTIIILIYMLSSYVQITSLIPYSLYKTPS